MKKTIDKTHKWEFGMYPISEEMYSRYEKSLFRIIKFLNNFITYNKILDDFSELKGMLNRTIKKNQFDWFAVYEKLHYPNEHELVGVIFLITELRNLLKNNDSLEEFKQNEKIFLCYLKKLIENYNSNINTPEEYLYILSLKNEPDVLKIGMTTGKVSKRVSQINSSTGILNPYGVRKVFKVKNCKIAERESHLILSDYRIRKDREFFKVPFSQALDLIEKSFTQNGLKIRNIGEIIYYNNINKTGKIKCFGIENIEFSKEDLVFENDIFEIGNLVEYDINIVKRKLKKIVKNIVCKTV